MPSYLAPTIPALPGRRPEAGAPRGTAYYGTPGVGNNVFYQSRGQQRPTPAPYQPIGPYTSPTSQMPNSQLMGLLGAMSGFLGSGFGSLGNPFGLMGLGSGGGFNPASLFGSRPAGGGGFGGFVNLPPPRTSLPGSAYPWATQPTQGPYLSSPATPGWPWF